MAQNLSLLKRGVILQVAPARYIRILSTVEDDQTFDPIVIYRPLKGGRDTNVSFSEFLQRFPDAEIGLPDFSEGMVFQLAGGIRVTVRIVEPQQDISDVLLTLQPDDGSPAYPILASVFLEEYPETVRSSSV